MKSTGNGAPEQCVTNLLRITRGEVPYERLKGIDPAYIDQPSATAQSGLLNDMRWMLGVYEPRAGVKKMDLKALAAQAGLFTIEAEVARR